MKQYLYITSSILILLCGCSKSERHTFKGEECIAFTPVASELSSKAGDSGQIPFEGDRFTISCFHMVDIPSIYFSDATVGKVAVEGGKYEWRFADGLRYYWPKGGVLSFNAEYPVPQILKDLKICQGKSMGKSEQGEDPYAYYYRDYTIKHFDMGSGQFITDDEDKTEANLAPSKKDFMVCVSSVDVESRAPGEAVPLPFGHNLTKIMFKIKAAKDYSSQYDDVTNASKIINDVEIRINNIGILGVYSVGTYKNTTPNWVDSYLKDKYNYYLIVRDDRKGTMAGFEDGQIGSRTPVATTVMDGNDADPAPLYMYAIPQPLDAASKLAIRYSVRQHSYRKYNDAGIPDYDLVDVVEDIDKQVSIQGLSAWAQGACVSYTITIGLDEIKVGASYVDWNTGRYTEPVIR